MGWPSLFARTLAVLPLLAPLLSAQVKYTGAEKGALGFGPLYTRVQDYGAVGIEIGYAADYRAGVAAFVTATGHAASLTIVGIAVETGVLRPQASLPLGVIAGLSMSQAFSGTSSSSAGGVAAQMYTEIGDSASLIWYPSIVGSLIVDRIVTPSVGVSSDLLFKLSEATGVDLSAQVSTSKLGPVVGINVSVLCFL